MAAHIGAEVVPHQLQVSTSAMASRLDMDKQQGGVGDQLQDPREKEDLWI
ncbi:MAG: hypothetical protein GY696_04230 [Gammaproteobacteria bacterium]|nr:hypothetical protein [Gammaproteobacteria bacterium]